jgi:DNA replication protein DnaC
MQPLVKAFKPVLISNLDQLEKPSERCTECEAVFDYEKNPDFPKDSSSLPQSVLNRLAWRVLPHPMCEAKILDRARAAVEIRKRQEMTHMLKRSGFPGNVIAKTLSSFQVDPDYAKEIELVKKWRPSDRYGFWLQGPPGCGKSHLMGSFVHRYFEAATDRVPLMAWWSVPFLFDQMTKDFGRDDRSEPTFNETLHADVLFLDDLGTQQGKPWETERLFQILDRRLNSDLPTFVTTNLASGEVKTLLHERLTSRLIGMCVPITLKARDRRRDLLADRLRELQRR